MDKNITVFRYPYLITNDNIQVKKINKSMPKKEQAKPLFNSTIT